jgi:hypothetical protein
MMVLDLDHAQALLSQFPGAGAVWVGKDGRVVASRDLPLAPAAAPPTTPS